MLLDFSLTVVIPWHKDQDALERAVSSVLLQTRSADELIIVCNGEGASDRDVIAAKYSSPLFNVIAIPCPDANEARNAGLLAAKSAYCTLLDCDDEFLPSRVEVLALVAATQKSGIFFSRGVRMMSGGRSYPFPRRGPKSEEKMAEYFFTGGNFVSSSAISGRTECLRRTLFTTGLRKFQDLDFLIRAQLMGSQIFFIPEQLYIYHDEKETGRISQRPIFDHLVDWARCYEGFDKKSRAAFLSRAVAQHELPRKFFLNTWRIFQGSRTGDIAPQESAILFSRFFLPKRIVRILYQLKYRR